MDVHFTRGFSAAHRVWNDPGKCSNVHGHNYSAEIFIDLASGDLTEQGFVVPFDVVKDVIDRYDHVLVIDASDPVAEQFQLLPIRVVTVPGVPSTEFMADLIAQQIADAAIGNNSATVYLTVRVELRETAGIEAHAYVVRSRMHG